MVRFFITEEYYDTIIKNQSPLNSNTTVSYLQISKDKRLFLYYRIPLEKNKLKQYGWVNSHFFSKKLNKSVLDKSEYALYLVWH